MEFRVGGLESLQILREDRSMQGHCFVPCAALLWRGIGLGLWEAAELHGLADRGIKEGRYLVAVSVGSRWWVHSLMSEHLERKGWRVG